MFKTSDDGDGISEFLTKFLPREGFFFLLCTAIYPVKNVGTRSMQELFFGRG